MMKSIIESIKNQNVKVDDHTINKNIGAMKKMQRVKAKCILNPFARENDFIDINFAVKEEFCNVKKRYGETIFVCSIEKCNFQLARLIIEFGVNSNYNQTINNDSDLIKYILKNQHFDVNEALMWASYYNLAEIVKILITVPGIDVNTKDNKEVIQLDFLRISN